ncbi:MAG TPA: bifunctional 4-hydroxy-2-oxoglutarate aldolase/2-dehydro-3-deoxy-phosphogluconate aldolase [Planctomycetota bacterium]|nr:bifunctional 4-hydroxy-2-oxoglutarate aldolase/2-dehydro-3-deoxy-phosphogluconate aldolase [Planctomycetota bacterium]
MARFRRLDTLRTIIDDGLVPVFYHPDVETAFAVAQASYRGGARTFELTHRGDGAHLVFGALLERARRELPDLVLGVGSISDPYTAAIYLALGADFVVGPTLHPDVARLANGRKIPYAPGCGTVTEIATAEELGSEIVKIFPGDSIGGPEFVRAVLGPRPWTSMLPTGGVAPEPESLREWFRAGIVAAGMGSKLITKDIVAKGAWDELEARVRQVLGWIREARERAG